MTSYKSVESELQLCLGEVYTHSRHYIMAVFIGAF